MCVSSSLKAFVKVPSLLSPMSTGLCPVEFLAHRSQFWLIKSLRRSSQNTTPMEEQFTDSIISFVKTSWNFFFKSVFGQHWGINISIGFNFFLFINYTVFKVLRPPLGSLPQQLSSFPTLLPASEGFLRWAWKGPQCLEPSCWDPHTTTAPGRLCFLTGQSQSPSCSVCVYFLSELKLF